MAATNPATSVAAPPPSPTTTSPRSSPNSASRVHAWRATATVLAGLAHGQPHGHERVERRPDEAQHLAIGDQRRAAGADQPRQLGQRACPANGTSRASSPSPAVRVDERVGGRVVETAALLVEIGEAARLGGQRPVAGLSSTRRHAACGETSSSTVKLLSRSRSRVIGEVTAPPPSAITASVSSSSRAHHPLLERPEGRLAVVAEDLRAIGLAASRSISASASKHRQPSRSASRTPAVVLPAPMKPISARLR